MPPLLEQPTPATAVPSADPTAATSKPAFRYDLLRQIIAPPGSNP
jgi:hypothetical protein